MILLITYFVILVWIKRESRENDFSELRMLYLCATVGVALAIIYRTVLIKYGFEYGLANLDMKNFIRMAERVSDMSLSDGLLSIFTDWSMSRANVIQLIGYSLYIYYLALSIFKWNFLSVETSVYLVSIVQILLANLSMLIIFNTLKGRCFSHPKLSLFLLLISPPIWFGCVRLLREAIMLLCIALILRIYLRKERKWILKLIVPVIILTIMRPYYTALMVPLCLLIEDEGKIVTKVNSLIFFGLCGYCLYQGVSPVNVAGVVLSPNFFNQVHYLNYSIEESLNKTGYIAIINYIGSVWNLFMLLFTILALVRKNRTRTSIGSVFLILDICMLYALAYGGTTELRHKMFFVVPYLILLNNGLDLIKGKKSVLMILMLMTSFISIYTLVVLFVGR